MVLSAFSNTTGYSNIAIGASALYRNTTKSNLVAVGDSALFNNGVGAAQSFEARYNTAIGSKALYSNTTGNDNTANGRHALRFNLTGSGNTANGYAALDANISGNYNTANGNFALYGNTTGHNNTCVGFSASPSSSSVSNYTGIGSLVGTGASASNMVEIGNSSVSVIRGQVGFTTYSDARIKENIQPDVPGLAFISQLKPVTYNLNVHRQNQMMYGTAKPDTIDWEGKYDIEKIRMTGFLAQDVEKAAQMQALILVAL
ncbi:MAG: tail fiber domain-containing protein [Sphingobacteriales bacterium]|nr:tail fiber domain-containing protein [Sphingobacteriales bacterium]